MSSIAPRPVLVRSGVVVGVERVQIGDVIKDPRTGGAATVIEHSRSTSSSLQLMAGIVILPDLAEAPAGLEGTPHSLVVAPGMRVCRLYRWVLRGRWQPPAPAPTAQWPSRTLDLLRPVRRRAQRLNRP